jgi:hypothetical protein
MNYLPLLIVVGSILLILYFLNKKLQKKRPLENKKTRSIDEWKSDLEVLWTGPPRTIKFEYESYGGELTRRRVDVARVSQDKTGKIYLHGYCHLRKEERSFNTYNILSDILEDDNEFELFAWLNEKLQIEGI